MSDSKSSAHIPTLDGFRAVSFLLVFVSHAGLGELIPGGFGVTVFFFLSGYLITTLIRKEQQETGTVSLKYFYLRRALRILPPFYIVLFVASGLTALGVYDAKLEWQGVTAQALHMANYWAVVNDFPRGEAPGTNVYWSLAVEEHFYLLFPLLFLILERMSFSNKKKALVLWAFCAVILVWRVILVSRGASEARTNLSSDTRVDSILFGCALALAANPIVDPLPANETLWKWVLLPLGLLGLVFSFVYRSGAFRETARYSLQGIALVPVFVVGIRSPGFGLFKILNWRPIAFVGALSYSLYLVHYVVILGVQRHASSLPKALQGALSLAISLVVSWAIYLFVEKPCARLRKRFTQLLARDRVALGPAPR
jgi:peptidoglycan/LPS O-acetylase OafA/YrhL